MFKSKKLSLVMALIFAFTVIAPFGAFASDIKVLRTPVVNDGENGSLGAVFFDLTAGQLKAGDTCTIRLPEDFVFAKAGTKDTPMTNSDWASVSGQVYGKDNIYGQPNGNYFKIPEKYLDNVNAFYGTGGLDIEQVSDKEIKVTVVGSLNASQNAYLYLYLDSIFVDDGFDGDIDLAVNAPSDSGFKSGTITVARVSSGAVDLEVTDAPTFSDSATTTIRVQESVPGSLEGKADSLKFRLPSGFEWGSVQNVNVFWGQANVAADLASYIEDSFKVDDDDLKLNLPAGFKSSDAIAFEVKVGITVEDETDAKLGDVIARVTGKSTYNQNELIVGKYGEYDITIEADEPNDLIAGMMEQEIADITIKESIKGSLIPGRTVLLTLPSNYKWCDIDEDNNKGVKLEFVGFPGKDGRTAKWVVGNNYSSSAAELVLEDMEVSIQPGTTGDLVIEVGGTAGLSGDLTVGKVSRSVEIAAASKPVLTIGKSGQAVANLTITENAAGALNKDADLELHLPEGFSWTKYSDIEVTEGDLKIDKGGITTGTVNTSDQKLIIPIDRKSIDASTIELRNLEIRVDRTAPEGDAVVKVKGGAVNEVNVTSEVDDVYKDKGGYYLVDNKECFKSKDGALFPAVGTAASTVFATVGTPAPEDQKLSTTITLGDNGSYISDGRIMVQLRDAANSLGVAEQNIFWDNNTKSATFVKGERVVQLTVGDPQVKMNGTALPTDKGAEIKDGRTYVSLRAAGIAFGAVVDWDNDTKTATLTVN